MSRTFAAPRCRVSIADDAWTQLTKHRQSDDRAKEAGGILLGRSLQDEEGYVVDSVTEPSGKDRRGLFFFFRSLAPAQRAVNLAWRRSGGTQIYLGEWHTHPEDYPTPSRIDVDDWRRVGRSVNCDNSLLFFVIVGIATTKVWVLDRATSEIVELAQVQERGGESQ